MLVRLKRFAAAILVTAFLGACAPLIAGYSLEAYKNATSLKAEVLALMDKGTEKYASHAKDIEKTTVKIDAAYEFAAGQAYNTIVATQWDILRDPNGGLYGGFVKTWSGLPTKTVSKAYISEKKKQISDAFDYIICVEANKQAAKPCPVSASEAAADQPGKGG
jgi:hypothetical protein